MTEPSPAPRIPIERLVHATLAMRDVQQPRRDYLKGFGGLCFYEDRHRGDDREMALLYIGDTMIEPMAPHDPADMDWPFARHVAKYGEGWHSIAYQTGDCALAARIVRAAGARITIDLPGVFFLHPSSTGGITVEITDYRMPNDPFDLTRQDPGWAKPRDNMPHRLNKIVCVVPELAAATRFLTEVLDGEIIRLRAGRVAAAGAERVYPAGRDGP